MTLATHEVQQLNQAIQQRCARSAPEVRSSPVASAAARPGACGKTGEGLGEATLGSRRERVREVDSRPSV